MSQIENRTLDVEVIRKDFPILDQSIYKQKRLVFLDNGASTQRPKQVIRAMVDCYEKTYANVHRGLHFLSEQSSRDYEQARNLVAKFIGCRHTNEIIFTSGTTHGINVVAGAWGASQLKSGDEILLTIMEHHSNIVPWQQLAERTGVSIRWIELTDDGMFDLDDFKKKLTDRVKLVAFTAVSNVLGTVTPVREITELAHAAGAKVLVDAAQHVPHDETNVVDWDVDFLTFSGHKMLGPSGIGVLYGKQELLEAMPPFMGGGSMISTVTVDGYTAGELPAKFEAGTPPIAQAIGLGAAVKYLNQFDMKAIFQYEQELAALAMSGLQEIDGMRILGPAATDRAGIVSFVVDGVSPQDMAILLDQQGIAVRAGHHCAMPLHDYLSIGGSCRASFYLYNQRDEVTALVDSLSRVVSKLRV